MDQWIRDQYKSKGGFGMTLESRRNASLDIRKDHRNSLLKRLRNIPENMSPLMSPMPPKQKVQNTHDTTTKSENTTNKTEKKTNKRLEQLKKWKQERDRRKLEEKKKAKPVFKVFHVEHKDQFDSIFNNVTGKSSHMAQTPVKPNRMNVIKPGKTITRSNKNSDDKLVTKLQNSKRVQNSTSRTNPVNKTPPSRSRSQTTKISKPQRNTILNSKSEVSNKTDRKENSKKSTKGKGAKISPEKSTEVNKGKQQKKTTKSSENNDIVQPKLNHDKTTTHKEKNDPSPDSDTTVDNEEIGERKDRLTESDSKQDINEEEDMPKRKNTRLRRKNVLDVYDSPSVESNCRSTRRQKAEKDNNKIILTPKETPSKKTQILRSPKSGSRSSASARKSLNTNSNEKDTFVTPPKKESAVDLCYVSPFVTLSRGKGAARKEFEQRKSLNRSISGSGTDPRSPKAAADYFTRKLEDEIERIQAMCRTWQNYKDEADLSEDACGLIDMTIGQSNLLITKKFNQFRGLIEKCQAKDEVEMTIKCEDLHGFWDMMYKQVTDLDKRFVNLEDMKKNNWLEKEPKIKTPKAVVTKAKRKALGKKTSKASSLLKETILAARKNRTNVKSEGEIEILIAKPDKTPKRKSRSQKELSTPMRGILKSGSVKTDKRKTVIFKNLRDSMDEDSSNLHVKGTPIPSRRSQRISLNRSKLNFEE